MKKLLSLTLTILVLCGMSSSAFAACRPCDTAPTLTYGCQAQQYIFNNGCWQPQPLPDCSLGSDWLIDSEAFWQNILEQINGNCTQNNTPDNDCADNDCNDEQNCDNDPNCDQNSNDCSQTPGNDAGNKPNDDPTQDDNSDNDQNDNLNQDNNANDEPSDPPTQDNTADTPEDDDSANTPENNPGTEQTPNNGANNGSNNPGSDQEQIVDQNESYIQQVLYLVNQERSANGLNALTLDNTVSAAAQLRAQECATSFSHTRPDGSSCFTALREMGVNYSGAAENIAYGQSTPQEVVNAWMNSDGHRKNILNSKYTEIGIGYAVINGIPYWSQFFIY